MGPLDSCEDGSDEGFNKVNQVTTERKSKSRDRERERERERVSV